MVLPAGLQDIINIKMIIMRRGERRGRGEARGEEQEIVEGWW